MTIPVLQEIPLTRSHILAAVLLLSVLTTGTASAVTVTSISPAFADAAGGTEVTIHGTGFSTCILCSPPLPPVVFFGGVAAESVTLVDSETLVVVTPPHPPGEVNVVVSNWDGDATLPAGFTFTGEMPEEAFERILVPLLTPPVHGAYGSEFHTELRIANRGTRDAVIHGLFPMCNLSVCPPVEFTLLHRTGRLETADMELNGGPGRFLYLSEPDLATLAMNLRVHDVTRSALNFGTEIPIVRESEFTRDEIMLTGIPGDSRFRRTLRIYATKPVSLRLRVGDAPEQPIEVDGGDGLYLPSYAYVELPDGDTTYSITIYPEPCLLGAPCPGIGESDFWAFVSVTNDDTQLISTITPQP